MSETVEPKVEPKVEVDLRASDEIKAWFDRIEAYCVWFDTQVVPTVNAMRTPENAPTFVDWEEALRNGRANDELGMLLEARSADLRFFRLGKMLAHPQKAHEDAQRAFANALAQGKVDDIVARACFCAGSRFNLPSGLVPFLHLLEVRRALRSLHDEANFKPAEERVNKIVEDRVATAKSEWARLQTEAKKNEDAANKAVVDAAAAIDAKLKEAIASVDALVATAQKAADSARQATGAAAAHGFAAKHEEAATAAQREADWWQRFAFAVALVAIAYIWRSAPQTIDARVASTTTLIFEMFRLFSGKIAIVSILAYVLAFGVRNFRAAKHNAAIHKHRAAVFQTFDSFHGAAKEDKTKDLVLTQTLQLVAASQPTGYLPTEPDSPPVTSSAELVATIAKLLEKKS